MKYLLFLEILKSFRPVWRCNPGH